MVYTLFFFSFLFFKKIFYFILFYFLTLQYCIGFAIYQNESATDILVFPILNPPPSSLPIPSLRAQCYMPIIASQVAPVVKNPPANAGDIRDMGSVSGLGRYPGGGHGNPLQSSCLENPHGQRSLGGVQYIGSHRV